MENVGQNPPAAGANLGEQPSGPRPGSIRDEADRNPIFDALVTDEGEVGGLVAYSLYKQNKRDWLDEFRKQLGRLPNEAETRAFIIGESTPRRLATYRQLAQTTLGQQTGRSGAAPGKRSTSVARALWVVLVLAALALVGYGLRSYGLLGPK